MRKRRSVGEQRLRECVTDSLSSVFLIPTSIALSLETDQILALYPDADTPFEDEIDVVNRLLPYHVFQNPGQDLNSLRGLKGKTKMTEEDVLKEEIRGVQNSFQVGACLQNPL